MFEAAHTTEVMGAGLAGVGDMTCTGRGSCCLASRTPEWRVETGGAGCTDWVTGDTAVTGRINPSLALSSRRRRWVRLAVLRVLAAVLFILSRLVW